MSVKNSLRKLRLERGLTLLELASRSGIGASTISEIERGRHLPKIDAALMLAGALNVGVDTVFWLERGDTQDGLEDGNSQDVGSHR